MIALPARRIEVGPDIGRARLAERAFALGTADGHDDRQLVHRRRTMPGRTDEAAVLGVGDRLRAQIEVVEVHAVDGPFVFLGVHRSHEEFATGHEREFGKRIAGHRSPRE